MPDLPRFLVQSVLDWIACDECGGDGTCGCDTCDGDGDACKAGPHVVVSVDVPPRLAPGTGYRAVVHADPARVMWWCRTHDEPAADPDPFCLPGDARFEALSCETVWRPVVRLDLTAGGDS